jgi:hypothetical protein
VPAKLVSVVIDSARPREVAGFWAGLLGWEVTVDLPEEVEVRAPAGDGAELDLTFVPVPEAKEVKNRLHLDLASGSPEGQQSIVDNSIELGARHVDIGQGAVPWVVLADPEDNEFCVLEPRPEYTSTGALAAIVVDARDPRALAEFWAEAIGWVIAGRGSDVGGLRPPTGRGPWLEFVHEEGEKFRKNRVHLDVAPLRDGDLTAEVERLTGLGAKRADVGQRAVPWEVLADPEGNEFCVLTPR